MYVLGVDIGGTNIKLGLVNPSGRVISKTNLFTSSFAQDKKRLIGAIAVCAQRIFNDNQLRKRDILGIGMGLPGLIDMKRGIVHFLVNIPGWKDVPLKSIMEKKIGLPVFIDNDVNLMALGEWRFGAGRGFKNLVCITLGTGVGGGLILDNALYRGEGFSAGEIGHIPLVENGPHCKCGGYGCLERYLGNYYLLAEAKKIFKKNAITLEEISQRAAQGEVRAIKFWQKAAGHLGSGLTGIVNLLNPRCIIIGGGVANAFVYFIKPLRRIVKTRAMKVPAAMVKIVKAQLGNDAGIIGAQVLVSDASRLR